MPYIDGDARDKVILSLDARTPGELNYMITWLVDSYLTKRQQSYTAYNEAIGVLECAKLELYRRLIAPYEDTKREENGDVYASDR